jgi:hypothetical protein
MGVEDAGMVGLLKTSAAATRAATVGATPVRAAAMRVATVGATAVKAAATLGATVGAMAATEETRGIRQRTTRAAVAAMWGVVMPAMTTMRTAAEAVAGGVAGGTATRLSTD